MMDDASRILELETALREGRPIPPIARRPRRRLCPPRAVMRWSDVGKSTSPQQLTSAGVPCAFQLKGGVFVALGTFTGVEISYEPSLDDSSFLPVSHGSIWPNPGDAGDQDVVGEDEREWGRFALRLLSGASGVMALALFADEDQAVKFAQASAGVTAPSSGLSDSNIAATSREIVTPADGLPHQYALDAACVFAVIINYTTAGDLVISETDNTLADANSSVIPGGGSDTVYPGLMTSNELNYKAAAGGAANKFSVVQYRSA